MNSFDKVAVVEVLHSLGDVLEDSVAVDELVGIEAGDKARLGKHHSDVGRDAVQLLAAVAAMAVRRGSLAFVVVVEALEVVEFLAVEMHLVVVVVAVVAVVVVVVVVVVAVVVVEVVKQQVVEKVRLTKRLVAVAMR